MPLVSLRIDVEAERQLRLPRPDIAIKLRDREDIEAVKSHVSVRPLADVVGQHAFAVIVGWWLCELARTRNVTAAHVEPIPLHPPLRDLCHGGTPFLQENFFSDMPPTSRGAVRCWEPREYCNGLLHGRTDGTLR